jgi:hypothetical protein
MKGEGKFKLPEAKNLKALSKNPEGSSPSQFSQAQSPAWTAEKWRPRQDSNLWPLD